MKHLETFHQPEPDIFTFFFDDVQPDGRYTMLTMPEATFPRGSRFAPGEYDPNGENAHLGERVLFHQIGRVAMDHFFIRVAILADEL